jgi:hypothetical protein
MLCNHRNAACRVEYTVRPEDIACSGELVMCRYTMHIRNCETVGGVGSCVQHGMLQCSFAPRSDRIVRADLVFDVMGFMQQLQVDDACACTVGRLIAELAPSSCRVVCYRWTRRRVGVSPSCSC